MADNGGRSELAKRLAQPATASPASRRGRPKHPDGWEPGIDTAKGRLTAVTSAPTGPDWTSVLTTLGLDSADWQVVDDVAEVRSWDVTMRDQDGQIVTVTNWYHRARVEPKRTGTGQDVDQLAREISRRRPLKRAQSQVAGQGAWLTVVLADWQAGKAAGGGPAQLVDRLVRLADEVLQRRRSLTRAGVPVRNLAILLAGDMVESCSGHFAQQTWSTELHMRDQVKLVRRSIVELVDRWAPEFDRITVAAAPGNHGEKRNGGGKSFTTWADNHDIEVVEQAAEVWAANPDRFGHVGVLLPDGEDLTVTVELDGLRVGVAHGHQAKGGGGGPQAKLARWWTKMAATRHPVGDCDLLVSGHYHHLSVITEGTHDGGARTHMQAPALDGGSEWWEHQGGAATSAGTLTFVAQDGRWSDLQVIPADG